MAMSLVFLSFFLLCLGYHHLGFSSEVRQIIVYYTRPLFFYAFLCGEIVFLLPVFDL